MSSRPSRKSSLFAVALLSLSASAIAAPRGGHDAPPPAPQRGARHDRDALSDSVRRIERTTRGQVLSAERVPFDGRDVNRIKTVDARGRVRVYMDDPADARPDMAPPPQLPDPPSE
jgi:hypothetical protein